MAIASGGESVCKINTYERCDLLKFVWKIEKNVLTKTEFPTLSQKFKFSSENSSLNYEFSALIIKNTELTLLILKNDNNFHVKIRTRTTICDKSEKILMEQPYMKDYAENSENYVLYFSEDFLNKLNDDTFVIVCLMYCHPQFVNKINPRVPLKTESATILKYDFGDYLQSSDFADITLRANDGTIIRAHKIVLGAVSSVFKAMLQSDMQESVSGEVFVEDMSMPVLKKLLKYIYGGDIQPINFEEAKDLYYAADKYIIDPLREVCAEVLKAEISKDNAHDVLNLAHQHSDKTLYRFALKFLERSFGTEE